jgi:hypothetical protein
VKSKKGLPVARWFIPFLLLACILAILGSTTGHAERDSNEPDQVFTLTGHVYFSKGPPFYLNGSPAANVTVEMYGTDSGTASTDASGTFHFSIPVRSCFDHAVFVSFKASLADPTCDSHVRPDNGLFLPLFYGCGTIGGDYNAGQMQLAGCTRTAPPAPTPSPAPSPTPVVDETTVPACPIPTPTPTDNTFVGTVSAATASTCTYHQPLTYDITANIPVDRVVGELDDNGRLVNPQLLVRNHVVSEFATLTIASYDVDSEANDPPYAPERDLVTINTLDPSGDPNPNASTYLHGQNKKWIINEFKVPIGLIKFGKKDPNGGPAIPGNNAVSLQVDIANAVNDAVSIKTRWCTTVAWAAIHFEAMSPVVMVHGNNSSGGFWNRYQFTKPFKDQGIPYDNSISMATGTVSAHGQFLAQKIPEIAKSLGAHTVHIITHSKGGLDVRDFLARPLPANFGVLSVTTLSGPHHGSVGADYALDSNDPNVSVLRSDDRERAFLAWVAGVDKGTPDLRVSKVEEFNQKNLPAISNKAFTVDGVRKPVAFFTYGADANLDGSQDDCAGLPPRQCTPGPTISYNSDPALNEIRGVDSYLGWAAKRLIYDTPQKQASLFQELYRLMGEVSSTKVDVKPNGKAYVREFHLCPHPLDCFQYNDFLVTMNSARLPGWSATELTGLTGANHATIATPEVAQRVITQIQTVQPIR